MPISINEKILSRFSPDTEHDMRRLANSAALFPTEASPEEQDDTDVQEATEHLILHHAADPDAMGHIRAAHESLSRVIARHGTPAPQSMMRFADQG
jgi:hypothetical protein